MVKKYSTIVKKHCKCIECATHPEISKWPTNGYGGYNYSHAPQEIKEKVGTKHKLYMKNRNKRNAISRALHLEQKKVIAGDNGYSERLNLWFRYQMTVSKKVCENCGVWLANYSEKEWYGSQHHIIEKSLCPSVASHPQNHIVLGFWCCHSQLHTSWLNMSKMACYEEMKKRFNTFKDCIDVSELSKLHKHPFLNEQ